MESKKRKVEYDILRIIAIIMVLYNHKDLYSLYFAYDNKDLRYWFFVILAIVCKTGPPLFFMVSGALLLNKEESIKRIFTHRIVRMLIVLIVIALSMRIFKMTNNVMAGFFLEANWYLYSYIGYLLMLPFLRKVACYSHKKEMIYYIFLVGIIYWMIGIIEPLGIKQSFSQYIGMISTDWAPFCWNIIYPLSGLFLTCFINDQDNRWMLIFLRVGLLITVIISPMVIYYDIKNNMGGNVESIIQHSSVFPSWSIFYSVNRKK